MKVCPGGPRVTTLTSLALLCLAASSGGLVRGVDARLTRVNGENSSQTENDAPKTCDANAKATLELSGTKTSFKIKCPGTAKQKLAPVESENAVVSGRAAAQQPNLDQAYPVTGAARDGNAPTCDTAHAQSLQSLAPGSKLTAANNKAAPRNAAQDEVQDDQTTATVFTLELGDGQEEDKRFCYSCTETGAAGKTSPCTIFVTVPKKETPKPEDQSPDSGSSSPSVAGWLTLSVAGSVVGMMYRL